MAGAESAHGRATQIAAETLNHPAHRALVHRVADLMNAHPKESMDILGSHLAYAYARGLVRGWEARETHRGPLAPFLPPEPLP